MIISITDGYTDDPFSFYPRKWLTGSVFNTIFKQEKP